MMVALSKFFSEMAALGFVPKNHMATKQTCTHERGKGKGASAGDGTANGHRKRIAGAISCSCSERPREMKPVRYDASATLRCRTARVETAAS